MRNCWNLLHKRTAKDQAKFRVEKVIKRNGINYLSNGKTLIVISTVRLIKRILLYKMSYFPEPYAHSQNKITVELYLSNSAAEFDLKSATSVDNSDFAGKFCLAALKSNVENIDVNKLKIFPIDFKKINDADDKNVLRKSTYNADKQGLDKKRNMLMIKYHILAD